MIKLHGIPKTIISDRDKVFSHFWQQLFNLSGTTLKMSTAYHPQTDGQSEVLNRCLEQYLRCFASDTPHKWRKLLTWAELWYNTSFHSSLGISPFQALYGRCPPTIQDYIQGSSPIEAVNLTLTERSTLLQQLRVNLQQAQIRMKLQADKHRRDLQFMVHDWVLVKLQPYRQNSVANRLNFKLSKRFYGPFQIIERIGPVAYKLALPTESKLHPVFHVSLLRPFRGDPTARQQLSLPPSSYHNKPSPQPARILQKRQVIVKDNLIDQLLIQWQGLPVEDSSWESVEDIKQLFPEFDLEDKAILHGGSNDTARGLTDQAKDSNPAQTIHPVHSRPRQAPRWLKDYV